MSRGLRRYLYFTAAMTGAAIMIVEILGANMLAPYVGTSHFVWTAQITVTLVPLALLAMTGPFFIRILTVAVTGVGGNVGRLTAISTLGSFVGTVLIGYVLIPFFRNSVTMYLTSALLVAVSAGYFFGWGRKIH